MTIGLVFLLRFEIKNVPPPQYFVTSNEGLPLALIDLRLPNLQPNNLLTWATEATVAAYSVNFVDFRSAIQGARTYLPARDTLAI